MTFSKTRFELSAEAVDLKDATVDVFDAADICLKWFEFAWRRLHGSRPDCSGAADFLTPRPQRRQRGLTPIRQHGSPRRAGDHHLRAFGVNEREFIPHNRCEGCTDRCRSCQARREKLRRHSRGNQEPRVAAPTRQ